MSKKYVKSIIQSLNSDQKNLFVEMQNENKLQICIPTGAGKGYLMIVDLLNQIVNTSNDIFAISTHRLMLNTQHLNDIFDKLSPYLGEIGFIFVGSSKYDTSKFQENVSFNKALLKKKLSYNEIVSSTTNTKEVDELVSNHRSFGRKVVILTTYHSLHTLKNQVINTIYNDEAHTLASESESAQFRENFEQIKFERCFFFTATPKDCNEDEAESFLMNNQDVFGRRTGLKFKECVEKAYIVKPVIHIAMPAKYEDDVDFKSIKNMAKFVLDTYEAHSEFIKQHSFEPNKIAPKILVKCPSVDEMWLIHKELMGKVEGVKICAGASRNPLSTFNHFIDEVGIVDRSEYLEKLQHLPEDVRAIVLHYDTMSEGINVAGFTGTEFLAGKLPTLPKTLQNTGRSTRLHKFDRDRVRTGEISTSDYSKWVKPYCAVIIPYWDSESQFTANELARQIKQLRDEFGYDPIYFVSLGCDIAMGKAEEDLDALNKKKERNKRTELIEQINNEIERLDQIQVQNALQKKVQEMTADEWFIYANNL